MRSTAGRKAEILKQEEPICPGLKGFWLHLQWKQEASTLTGLWLCALVLICPFFISPLTAVMSFRAACCELHSSEEGSGEDLKLNLPEILLHRSFPRIPNYWAMGHTESTQDLCRQGQQRWPSRPHLQAFNSNRMVFFVQNPKRENADTNLHTFWCH